MSPGVSRSLRRSPPSRSRRSGRRVPALPLLRASRPGGRPPGPRPRVRVLPLSRAGDVCEQSRRGTGAEDPATRRNSGARPELGSSPGARLCGAAPSGPDGRARGGGLCRSPVLRVPRGASPGARPGLTTKSLKSPRLSRLFSSPFVRREKKSASRERGWRSASRGARVAQG